MPESLWDRQVEKLTLLSPLSQQKASSSHPGKKAKYHDCYRFQSTVIYGVSVNVGFQSNDRVSVARKIGSTFSRSRNIRGRRVTMFSFFNYQNFVPLFPNHGLMLPRSLRFFAHVLLFLQTPGRPSGRKPLTTQVRSHNRNKK